MTQESIILEGKKLEELIEEGLKKLGKTKEEEIDINVLEKGINIGSVNIKKFKVVITAKKIEIKESVEQELLQQVKKQEPLTSFKLIYKEDGVYLSIVKEKDDVDHKAIMEKIDEKEVKDLNDEVVIDMIKKNQSNIQKIAPLQEEKLIDGKIELIKAKDDMIACLIVYPADGGKTISHEEIISNLKEHIAYGLDESLVKAIVDEEKFNEEVVVARGNESVDGRDGFIEYMFENDGEASPYILEDGSVDYRRLNLISNVKKGDLLAILHPPEDGIDGHNIKGEVRPFKPGITKHFKYGKNIEVSEDGFKLFSLLDGQVCNVNEKLTVYELYTIKEDVDNSTGDIDFEGNVKVNGSVLTGFSINAKGNVEIDGAVEGANIDCGGNLIIKRGIQGYNMAKINAGGSVITKYIENANVICGADLESEAIMHSHTLSEGNIIVGGKKGLIVGGTCKSAGDIKAREIGSHMATDTVLEVGLDPRVREKQEQDKKTLLETEMDIDKFSKMINHLNKLGRLENLSQEKQDLLQKSMTAKFQLEKRMIELSQEVSDVDERIKAASNGTISVADVLHLGVKIAIGSSNKTIEESTSSCNIYRDTQDFEIKIRPFTQ